MITHAFVLAAILGCSPSQSTQFKGLVPPGLPSVTEGLEAVGDVSGFDVFAYWHLDDLFGQFGARPSITSGLFIDTYWAPMPKAHAIWKRMQDDPVLQNLLVVEAKGQPQWQFWGTLPNVERHCRDLGATPILRALTAIDLRAAARAPGKRVWLASRQVSFVGPAHRLETGYHVWALVGESATRGYSEEFHFEVLGDVIYRQYPWHQGAGSPSG